MGAVRTPPLTSLEDLRERLEVMHEHIDRIGRTEPIDVCFSPFANEPPALLDELQRMHDLGVTWAILHTGRVESRSQWIDEIARLGDEVIAPSRA